MAVFLIDGSNFYFKLKDLKVEQEQYSFNYLKFAQIQALKEKLSWVRYYVGAVRTDGTEKVDLMHAQQQKLLTHILATGSEYKLGYLLKSEGVIHEKGVDVEMAVDMLKEAYAGKTKKIYLLSSDTDLLPAILECQRLGVKIVYVGFKHMPSLALSHKCDEKILLGKRDILKFVDKKIPANGIATLAGGFNKNHSKKVVKIASFKKLTPFS